MKVKKQKIVVGMSGGVDSSVAAALLKQAGFDVVGVMMKFWHEGADGKNRCCSVESEKLARMVAKKLDIPFYVVNVEREFKKAVVDYFLAEYKKGNTPNPCVVCNKEIKFGFLIKKALSLGANFVATGHYARTSPANQFFSRLDPSADGAHSPQKKLLAGLLKAKDKDKDQSYFLWQLNQKQLSKVLFPLGNYTKPEVRKLAEKFGLPTAKTPESQEVCFVHDTTNNFLRKYLKLKFGQFLDMSGKVVGEHRGLWFYTIGQRKGLEISQGPWFVVKKDFKNNILIVSKNKKDLLQKELVAKNVNWISGRAPRLPLKVKVKIRYRAKLASAKIFKLKTSNFKLLFDVGQKAVTPGQSVVFYGGKELLGGGVIQ